MLPIRIEIKPSNILISLSIIVDLFTMLLLLYIQAPILIFISGIVISILASVKTIRFHGLRSSSNAIVSISTMQDGKWLIRSRQQTLLQQTGDVVSIRRYRLLTNFLVILHFVTRTHRKNKTLIIFRDAIPNKEWRHLAIWLRYSSFDDYTKDTNSVS